MCVVMAEAFYKNPEVYFERAQSEDVTVVTNMGSFSIKPKVPNAETLEAMEEGEQVLADPNTKRFTSVEALMQDLMDGEEC